MLITNWFHEIGSCLSLLCALFVITTWCMLPKFRTLQNYISMNQIANGALHLFISNMSDIFIIHLSEKVHFFINGLCFSTTLCWSFCSSLDAYTKLVLLYNCKISYEKRKATAFVYATVATTKLISVLIVPRITHVSTIYAYGTLFAPIFYIMIINLVIFIKIFVSVMSCCNKKLSKRSGKHVVSLIGLGLLCDSALIINVITLLFSESNILYIISEICFTQRITVQALFLLLKKSTRDLWKKYFSMRKRVANDLRLLTRHR